MHKRASKVAQIRSIYPVNALTPGFGRAGDLLRARMASNLSPIRPNAGPPALTTDGPFAETKEQLTGYYLLGTSTADEAVAIAARIPAAGHGSMEVRPILIFSRPRMSIFIISHVVQVEGALRGAESRTRRS